MSTKINRSGIRLPLVILAFLVLFIMSPKPAALAEEPLFPDLSAGSEYYVAVNYLKELGLIQGYPDGFFRPKQQINRAEALKILVGAINYGQFSPVEKPLANLEASPDQLPTTLPTGECPFPDLEPQAWYFPYVCSAYKNSIISGYPDGFFRPEQTINKVEALKIALLQTGLPLQTDYNDNFNDISPNDWFWEYARIADQYTIIVSDRQGDLHPDEMLNRGDFSLLVYRLIRSQTSHSEFGRATYYAGRFDGRSTASGETYSANLPTAAHKTLPFDTVVRVTNMHNGKQIDVRINDRGPYVDGTIIDLSSTAFAQIASLSTGVVQSEIEIISQPANEQ